MELNVSGPIAKPPLGREAPEEDWVFDDFNSLKKSDERKVQTEIEFDIEDIIGTARRNLSGGADSQLVNNRLILAKNTIKDQIRRHKELAEREPVQTDLAKLASLEGNLTLIRQFQWANNLTPKAKVASIAKQVGITAAEGAGSVGQRAADFVVNTAMPVARVLYHSAAEAITGSFRSLIGTIVEGTETVADPPVD